MKQKSEETSLADGELWEQFKKTEYFLELDTFILERTKDMRDRIVQASMNGKYDEARDVAQQLSGFRIICDFIDDTISTRAESLEYEREAKEFNKQLPHRL
jgi:hypothetical protein